MKTLLRAGFITLLLAAGYAFGQVQGSLPTPPDVLTSQAAAAKALTDYKGWLESQLATLWTNQQAHEAKLSSLSDQSAAVTALQQQLAADEARIKALEDAVAALQQKVTAAGSTLAKP
jgi:hypothetical protein